MKNLINKILEFLLLSHFVLRFEDQELEDQFIEKTFIQNYTFNKYIYVVGSILFLLFYILLYCFFPNANSNIFLMIPFVIAIFNAIIIFTLMHVNSKFIRTHIHTFILFSILIGITTLIFTMLYHRPINIHIAHCGMLLLIISGFTFIRIQFPHALFYMVFSIILYELFFINLIDLQFVEIVFYQFLYMCTILIGITVNYYIEKKERHNFLKLKIIVEGRIKMSELND